MVKKKRRQEGGAPSKERGTLPTPRVSKCWSPVALYRAHSTDKCPQERSYTQSPLFFLLSLSFYLLYSVSLFILSFSSLFLSQFVVHSSKTKSFVTIRIFISRQISNSDFKRFIQDLIIQNKIVG